MKDYKFKISIIIPVYNAEEYLVETIESVILQTLDFKKNIQLILVNDGSTDSSEDICKEYQQLYPENVKYIKKRNGGVSSTRNVGLSYVEGKYLNFLDSDDKWGMNVCETVYNFFEEHYDEIDVIGVRIKYFEARNSWHALDHKFHNGNRVADLTTEEECSTIQLSAATTFIKTEAITKDDRFDETIKYGEDSLFINRIILRKLKLGVLSDVLYYYRFRNNQSSAIQTQKFDPDYYDYAAKRYYDGIINASKELYGEVVPYIQQVLAYDIGWRVGMPLPEEISGDEAFYNEYMEFLKDRLQYVDESIILKNKVHKNITKKEALIDVKNGGGFYENTSFLKEEETICYKDMPLIHLSGKHGCCHVNFCELFKNDEGKDYLRIEGYVAKWLFNCCQDKKKELVLRIGRKRTVVKLKEYPFLPERNIFGERQRYYYFQEELPFEPKLDKENTVNIRLALQIGDDIANLSLKYGKFIADTRIFKAAYQIYGKYVFTFNRKRIVVRKPDDIAKEHRKLELKSISWLVRNKLIKYARIRARVAWLKKTKYAGKRLWIITDRFEKAGDNGEAFFRYLNSGEVDLGNIEPVFAISRDSVDVKRLKSIGDGGVGVDDAIGVGVLGHTPDALDGGILHQLFHQIHIGTFGGHGNGDQLGAEALGDLKVAVIAGGGAQEFDGIQLAPGLFGVEQTMGVGLCNGIVHQSQAGVAADEAFLRLAAKDIGPQLLGSGDAGELAVVANIQTVGHAVGGGLQGGEHIADKVQLFPAGLAAGHIQMELLSFQLFKAGFDSRQFSLPLLSSQIAVKFRHVWYLRCILESLTV